MAYSAGGELRVDWGPKIQALAGALLIQVGRPISRTQLAEWVWRDDEKLPVNLPSTMHTYANRLRTYLGHADGVTKLSTKGGAFRIDADPDLVDYHRFRAIAEQARAALSHGDPKLALAKAAEAIGLWRNEEPLFGLTSTKVENWRRRVITDEYVPAQDTLLQALLSLGDFQQAQLRLNELQRDHPDQPAFMKRRIQTLHGLGRVEEATTYLFTQYKALRARGEDIAAAELQQLHQHAIDRPAITVSGTPKPPPPRRLHHRLPPDVPTFVGRDVYLAKLDGFARTREGVRRPCLIVLDGQGGVGKTTLALHWAHRLGGSESIFYYDLQGIGAGPRHEADEVVDELLAALDYPVERLITSAQRRRKLGDLLAERPLVVVLDNVQRSEHVRGLLPLLADCTVLLISRQRLTRLRTQHHAIPLLISPLDTHQGANLLTRLIGRRATDTPHAVTTLAQLSGGLPIALKLIAHHVEKHPHVPLAEIIDDLHDKATFLGIGDDGDAPATSLRATFAMSYEALSPTEQDLFATLALHPGRDISLAAAAAMAGQPISTVRKGLDALIGAHMIEPGSSVRRYQMHDLHRTFGQERAGDRSTEDNDRRMLRLLSWCLHSSFGASRTMFPNRVLPGLLPLEPGVVPENFATERHANAWLVAERDNLLDIIAWSRTRHPSYADRLPSGLYRTLRQYGHYAEARDAFQIAIDAAHMLGDLNLEGGSRHSLGQLLLAMNEPALAALEFHRAAGLAALDGSDVGIAVSTYSLAGIAVGAGRFAEGIQLYEQALDRAKSTNLVEPQAAILMMLGQAYREQGSRVKAFPYFQQACWLAGSLHDSHLLIRTLLPLAEVFAEQGDREAADVHARRALDLVVATHDLEEAPGTFLALARINAVPDRFPDAVRYARQAVRFARQRRYVEVEALALDVLATGLAALGHPEGAREGWEHAREIFVDRGKRDRAALISAKLEKLPDSPPRIPTARTVSADNVAMNGRSVIED
ncbi:MAG TPA: BTAD domain-containing putative transcriptional regulator [Pseudonocardiaceae bacterium]|nr:BTAD domain-containing putative transcriptional regulator [Pseudonocardiaceae bacterium]